MGSQEGAGLRHSMPNIMEVNVKVAEHGKPFLRAFFLTWSDVSVKAAELQHVTTDF